MQEAGSMTDWPEETSHDFDSLDFGGSQHFDPTFKYTLLLVKSMCGILMQELPAEILKDIFTQTQKRLMK